MDVLGGVVCGFKELMKYVYYYCEINGVIMDFMLVYFILRGMKMLKLCIC